MGGSSTGRVLSDVTAGVALRRGLRAPSKVLFGRFDSLSKSIKHEGTCLFNTDTRRSGLVLGDHASVKVRIGSRLSGGKFASLAGLSTARRATNQNRILWPCSFMGLRQFPTVGTPPFEVTPLVTISQLSAYVFGVVCSLGSISWYDGALTMPRKTTETWFQLCNLAAIEEDPVKLLKLVQ